MAPLLHAEVPPTSALGAVCSGLTLVEVEIKTKSSVVLISPNAPFVCQLLGENVRRPVALLLAFSFALVPLGALLPSPRWLAWWWPIVRVSGRRRLALVVTTFGLW